MIKVKRENVIYSISEEDKEEYLKKGYSLLDSNGKEIKEMKKKDNKEVAKLLKQNEELTSTIESLKSENQILKEENENLVKQIKNLTGDTTNKTSDKKDKE